MTNRLSDSKVSSMVLLGTVSLPSNMTTFFAIPGASGKVRLKLEMPEDAGSVMIRYKTSAWASGDGIATGTLVATLTENYNLANEWYEVSGLTNGTAYYFKAFPYNGIYNSTIGENETVCKAGGLIAEYTMDSITGSTLNDTSGNNKNGTINGATSAVGFVGNALQTGANKYVSGLSISGCKAISFRCSITDSWGSYQGQFPFATATTDAYILVLDKTEKTWHAKSPITDIIQGVSNIGDTPNLVFNEESGVTYLYENNIKASGSAGALSNQGTITLMGAVTGYLSTEYWGGLLDQVRFFNRPLEEYERTNLYNGGTGC